MKDNSANQKLATEYCDRMASRDIDKVMEMFAEDCRIQTMVKPGLLPGTFPTDYKSQRDSLIETFKNVVPKFIARNIIVDGDRIAIEAVGDVMWPEGGRTYHYENTYVFLIEARDGKIVALREYMDTAYAKATYEYIQSQHK